MTEHVETVIVGAGQAGLSASRCLTDLGREHLVLERGRIAERWRSERWDSFRLLSPNWYTNLPGYRYDGADADGFMDRSEVVGMFDGYARSFAPPVRTGVTVTGVRPADASTDAWRVDSDRGRIVARNVVVASGHLVTPVVPALGRAFAPGITQLHTRDYRNPEQLPAGGVLIVGAGPSGQQIARELRRAGRPVHLAAGRHRVLPRRYRGHDAYWWMRRLGVFDRTIDEVADPDEARRAPNPVLTGTGELDLRGLAAEGVVPVGRLVHAGGTTVEFANDLAPTVSAAERNAHRFREMVDAHVRRHRLDVPDPSPAPGDVPAWAVDAPTGLDLAAAGVTTVIWATGFRSDFGWIHAPVLDAAGEPVQRRGVTAAPGLYFLGLRWMWRHTSNLLGGVGDDAAYVVEHLAERRSGLLAAA